MLRTRRSGDISIGLPNKCTEADNIEQQENNPDKPNRSTRGRAPAATISMNSKPQAATISMAAKPEPTADEIASPSTPVRGRRKLAPEQTTPSDSIRRLSLESATTSPVKPVTVKGEKLSFDEEVVNESQERSAFGSKITLLPIDPKVDKVYRLIRKSTGALGGNGTTGAIYGELTMHSMQKVLNLLIEKCELNHTSRFIDVGSGLGKPNFHAAQDPAVRLSLGVELEHIRWQLAMHNLFHVVPEMKDCTELSKSAKADNKLYSNVNFICQDIDAAASMDPFTHIYMYDLGFPPPLQQSIARKFNNSVHGRYLISYRPPHRVMHEYGYKVDFVDQIPTTMHGSHEVHTAYLYRRINRPAVPKASDIIVRIPARAGFDEEDVDVVCDPVFLEATRLAVGKVADLKDHVVRIACEHMTSERPRRERKPVNYAI